MKPVLAAIHQCSYSDLREDAAKTLGDYGFAGVRGLGAASVGVSAGLGVAAGVAGAAGRGAAYILIKIMEKSFPVRWCGVPRGTTIRSPLVI